MKVQGAASRVASPPGFELLTQEPMHAVTAYRAISIGDRLRADAPEHALRKRVMRSSVKHACTRANVAVREAGESASAVPVRCVRLEP